MFLGFDHWWNSSCPLRCWLNTRSNLGVQSLTTSLPLSHSRHTGLDMKTQTLLSSGFQFIIFERWLNDLMKWVTRMWFTWSMFTWKAEGSSGSFPEPVISNSSDEYGVPSMKLRGHHGNGVFLMMNPTVDWGHKDAQLSTNEEFCNLLWTLTTSSKTA